MLVCLQNKLQTLSQCRDLNPCKLWCRERSITSFSTTLCFIHHNSATSAFLLAPPSLESLPTLCLPMMAKPEGAPPSPCSLSSPCLFSSEPQLSCLSTSCLPLLECKFLEGKDPLPNLFAISPTSRTVPCSHNIRPINICPVTNSVGLRP